MRMRTHRKLLPALVFVGALLAGLAGLAAPTHAEDEGAPAAPAQPLQEQAPRLYKQPALAVSAVIDARIDAALAGGEVVAAPQSDDAEFLRRITLDLLGTVPTAQEVTRFLGDKDADKRTKLIDDLLASEAYADNFGVVWFKFLTGLSPAARGGQNGQGARYISGASGKLFLEHLQSEMAANRPYDEFAHDLVTARGRTDENGATGFIARWSENVNNLASATSKVFLGTRIQCAQCHDHIYEEDWKQKDFQAMAAFFATMRSDRVPEYREYQQLRNAVQERQRAQQRPEGRRPGGTMAPSDTTPSDTMGGESMDGAPADGESMDGAPTDGETMGGEPGATTPKPTTTPEERRRAGRRQGTDYSGLSASELQAKLLELRGVRNTLVITDATPDSQELANTKRRFERAAARNNGVIPERIRDRLTLLTMTPKFWMGSERKDIAGIPRRLMLARWMTAPENTQFAKTVVNRYWHLFLGTGFVNPVDDFNSFNEASDPELLDLLADQFIHSGYDLQRLIRIITNTKADQRTSRWEGEAPDASYFAKAAVRPLTTEQVYHSLLRASGVETVMSRQNRRSAQRMQQAIFSVFSFVFDDDEGKETQDFEGSIPQGLFLMNGELMQGAIAARRGSMLDKLLRDTRRHSERVDTLYLMAYGRHPSPTEKTRAVRFVERAKDERPAYEDLLWALLNSAEFMTNH